MMNFLVRLRILVLALLSATPRLAFAQDEERPNSGVQGSFRPPLVSTLTEDQYLAAAGMLAFAGPLTIYGAFVGVGAPLSEGLSPLFAYETLFDAVHGSGTLAGLLPPEFGGPDLALGLWQFGAALTIKCKPLHAADNGYVGLLVYGGLNLGLNQLGTTTGLGTAYSTGLMTGGSAGVVLEGRLGPWVDLMAFGGYRLNRFGTVSASDLPDVTVRSPEYGGDIAVHLLPGIDLKLSTLFSLMRQAEDDQGIKQFMIGVTLRPEPPPPAPASVEPTPGPTPAGPPADRTPGEALPADPPAPEVAPPPPEETPGGPPDGPATEPSATGAL